MPNAFIAFGTKRSDECFTVRRFSQWNLRMALFVGSFNFPTQSQAWTIKVSLFFRETFINSPSSSWSSAYSDGLCRLNINDQTVCRSGCARNGRMASYGWHLKRRASVQSVRVKDGALVWIMENQDTFPEDLPWKAHSPNFSAVNDWNESAGTRSAA